MPDLLKVVGFPHCEYCAPQSRLLGHEPIVELICRGLCLGDNLRMRECER